MSSPIHLSIIIPAYREELRLRPTLEAIESFRRVMPWASEVIIVDDCSPDGTARVASAFMTGKEGYRLLRQEKNQGKGAAVRRGMLEAKGAYRLFTDADLSTPIEEVETFFPFADGRADGVRYEVVIGSRRVKGARLEQRQPLYREASGRVFSALTRMIAIPGILDTQCGFKMFTAEAAEAIFPRLTIPGFGFDVEALYIAFHVLGYKVKEAPVRWKDSPATHVRLFQDSLRMFRDLLQVTKNFERGVYGRIGLSRDR